MDMAKMLRLMKNVISAPKRLGLEDMAFKISDTTYFPNESKMHEIQDLVDYDVVDREDTKFYLAGDWN